MTLVEELRALAPTTRSRLLMLRAADRIEELEKAFLMVARNFAKASARIEELEKQFLARTGQAASSGLQSPHVDPLPSVTPESQQAYHHPEPQQLQGVIMHPPKYPKQAR